MSKLSVILPIFVLVVGAIALIISREAATPEIAMPEFVEISLDGDILHVARNEVSSELWSQCVAEGVCGQVDQRVANSHGHPVVNVSYYEVLAFLEWFEVRTDIAARLPTQVEWMTLAADHLPMPKMPLFSDPRLAWAADYDMLAKPQNKITAPMGTYGENALGINDIKGNVWEWTASECADGNITGVAECPAGRVAMGGHTAVLSPFVGDPGNAGCGGGQPPANLGFRLVF